VGGDNIWLRLALSFAAALASLGWFWRRFGRRFVAFFGLQEPAPG
jgi:hypothetical protein